MPFEFWSKNAICHLLPLIPSNSWGPEFPEWPLLLGTWLYLFYMCLRDDRKRESSKMAKAFRYTKKVVFNVGFSVLFLVEQSIIEQAKIRLENKVYIFYLWELLNKTCLYCGPGINSDLPWAGDWPPGCLKPSRCSGSGPWLEGTVACSRCLTVCAARVFFLSLVLQQIFTLFYAAYHLFDSEIHWFSFYDKLVLYNHM